MFCSITFFAPPDSAFPKPPHHELKHLTFVDDITESDFDPAELPLVDLLREVDSLDAMDDDDDEKKERRRKIIKYIVGAVLSYHVLPQPLNAAALSQNTTYATNLTLPEGSLDGQALRLRISSAPFSPVLNVNLFSKIVGSEVLTGNGVIHVVSFPILPPPAVFTGQFNAPSFFSISVRQLATHSIHKTHTFWHRHRPFSVLVLRMKSTTFTCLPRMGRRDILSVPGRSLSSLRQTGLSRACPLACASSSSLRSATELSRSCFSTTLCLRMLSTRVSSVFM
jgi:uncharacterized surface protein with fasciclin (FAS1) repeats